MSEMSVLNTNTIHATSVQFMQIKYSIYTQLKKIANKEAKLLNYDMYKCVIWIRYGRYRVAYI